MVESAWVRDYKFVFKTVMLHDPVKTMQVTGPKVLGISQSQIIMLKQLWSATMLKNSWIEIKKNKAFFFILGGMFKKQTLPHPYTI